MKITNKKNLPDIFVEAIRNDPYNPGSKTDISTTTLIRPPQQVSLQREHKGELTEDVSERIWALFGSISHGILERAWESMKNWAGGYVVEERYYTTVAGWVVSGQIDIYQKKGGILSDVKTTSVWAVKAAREDGKSDWDQQLNILALLCRENLVTVDKLQIIALCRDWSPSGALRDSNYPDQVEVIEIPLWSKEKQESYIEERVRLHQEAREGNYGPCTASERWEKPNTYAIKKEGRKSALRVLQTEEEAASWIVANKHGQWVDEGRLAFAKGISIEFRQGESTRCEKYCSVRDYCQQYASIIGAQQ